MKTIFWFAFGGFLLSCGIIGFFRFEENQLNQCNKLWAEKVAKIHFHKLLKSIEYKDYRHLTIREIPRVLEWEKDIKSCIDYTEFKNQSILEGITDPDSTIDRGLFEVKLASFLEKSACIDSYCQVSTGCYRTETNIPFLKKFVLCELF